MTELTVRDVGTRILLEILVIAKEGLVAHRRNKPLKEEIRFAEKDGPISP